MDFYEKNISVLRISNPSLYSMMSEIYEINSIRSIVARDGNKVPIVNLDNREIYIHSKFDPVREAKRLISEISTDKTDLFIIFGFGFAYHIEELLNRMNDESVLLVLEMRPEMIKKAITDRDLTGILADRRLNVIASPDEDTIAVILKGKSSRRVSYITHRGSFQTAPEYYSNLTRIIKSYLSSKDVNIATLSKFEKTWSANIARNILLFVNSPGAGIFYDRFRGIPALVIAAGPSLNNSMEFIRENREKAIIIAVDTSYKILRKNGIDPHFCLTVDPQLVNSRYFEGDTECETILVADPTVNPSTFRLTELKVAVLSMAFDMMKWVEDITSPKGELAYGGSVTTNAYDFAKRIGASPVVLIGQDLAFTNGLAHARGSYLDELVHLRINRFSNAHMFNRGQLTALPRIFIEGIRSGEVHTNQKMMIFLQWFEKRGDPDLINAACDGARLKGVKHIPLEELSFSNASANFSALISQIYNSHLALPENNYSVCRSLLIRCEEMRKSLAQLIPVLERVVSLSDEFVSLVSKDKRDQGKIDYILNKLSEADRLIRSMTTLKDMIGFTIQRVIHTITEGYEINDDDDSLSEDQLVARKSRFLYKGLLEGSLFNNKILTKMIAMLRMYQKI